MRQISRSTAGTVNSWFSIDSEGGVTAIDGCSPRWLPSSSCATLLGTSLNALFNYSTDRTILHVLNQSGAPGSLPDAEFNRAAGQAPDIFMPYDRDIGRASALGTKGTQNCAKLRQALVPLIRSLSGEQGDKPKSLLGRIFGS